MTPRKSPQLNGSVERKFATLVGRSRAVHQQNGYTKALRRKLWAETVNTVTDYENILTLRNLTDAQHKQFYADMINIDLGTNLMRQPGEIGIVAKRETMPAKLDERGTPVMYLGIAKGYIGGTHRLLNLKTNMVIHSRDVIWLDKTYNEYKKGKKADRKRKNEKAWEETTGGGGADDDMAALMGFSGFGGSRKNN